jgi:hypothetical protein
MTAMVVTVRNLTQDAVELLNVVMDTAMVMKPKHHVRKIVHLVDHVKTVNLIGQLTDLNAAIRHGMSLALIALHLKVHMAGIAPVVTVQVMAAAAVNVVMVKLKTALMTIAAQSLGLVMVLKTVKTKRMVVT